MAQSGWPSGRPIRIVVPFAAGGASDVAARVLSQALSESLKTPVIVDNKPGAHGTVGASEVLRSQADGYTLFMGSTGTMAINPRLHEKLPYDVNKDFVPVSLVTIGPNVVVVNPRVLPVNDMPSFVRYLKENPGKVNYASAGSGNSGHLTAEYFKARTGTFMTHIPYRGDGAAMSDLVGGQVQVMFTALLGAMPHIKSGRLRLLATTARQRLAEFPDVPTVEQSLQLSGFDAVSWQAIYAAAGTPPEIVNRLSEEFDATLKDPAIVKRIHELGALPGGGTPARLAAFQKAEQEKWGSVIRTAKIKPE
ncbi:Bug family tripartite tricarboxylate transporter substrate binding protein [Variovorax sp. LjRoot178]|uniref:Bug family tripartite tricarboxylate transporter substrate binding protein n=1 Tax=Variovorax sp. LjRoot178 TaxID=3342277 RepID=UPI003ECDFC66